MMAPKIWWSPKGSEDSRGLVAPQNPKELMIPKVWESPRSQGLMTPKVFGVLKVPKVSVVAEVWRFQVCKDLVSPRFWGFSHPTSLNKTPREHPQAPCPLSHIPMGEVGRAAGDVVAMKSAICRSAHTCDELFPFFICSWIRLSSSSRKDCSTRDEVTTG